MPEPVVKYKIYFVSEDGLLKQPKDYLGDSLFPSYGYDEEYEALQAIERNGSSQEFCIIKFVSFRNY